jgi:hypothetical protein
MLVARSILKRKRGEKLEKNNKLKRTFICNTLQNKDSMISLQSYQHPLHTKNI